MATVELMRFHLQEQLFVNVQPSFCAEELFIAHMSVCLHEYVLLWTADIPG